MPAPIIAAYNPFLKDHAPVDFALAAAELTGGNVIIASVPRTPYGGGWADLHAVDDGTIELELTRLRDEFGVQTRIITDTSVPRALHGLARDESASMIVVGSTARGPAGRVLPGSTAERLLHGSPCAVALAPRGHTRAPVETVAVGFVDSPEGHAALAVAHMLAGRANAKLRVIAALHPSSALDAPTADSTPPPRGLALEGRHRASMEATLSAALNALPAGVEVEPEIHIDDPAEVCCACPRRRTARVRLPRLWPATQCAARRRLAPPRRCRAVPRSGAPARSRPPAPGPVRVTHRAPRA